VKLSIGIVNFNAGHRIRQCIEAIAKHPPSAPFEVIVIDNDSRDGSGDFLSKGEFPFVRYEKLPYNLGYTGGFNRAFELARGEHFFVYNFDIVAQPNSFDRIVAHMDADPTIGAIGGWQMSVDGRFEKYVNRLPRPYDAYLANFVSKEKAGKDERYRRYQALDLDFRGPVEVEQPAGGCLLVRSSIFPEGLMSDVFGIFWSDVEMARKVKARGYRLMMFPDAAFTHDHDWSKKPVSQTRLLVDLDYYVGAYRYFRMYEGRWASLQVRMLFGARLLGRLIIIEFPKAWRQDESWAIWRARAGVLWSFLLNRNVLLERERARQRSVSSA
jgi:hypothetical protein